MRWRALALGLAVPVLAAPGWRYDGGGRWPVDGGPTAWGPDRHLAWSTDLPAWSNASPVPAAGRVCVASEPVTLHCLDAATGRLLWSADHPVIEAVPEARRAEVAATIARVETLEAELKQVRAAYGQRLRDARRSGSADATAELEALAREVDRLKAALDALSDPRTPPTQGIIGWSSPTPATDDDGIYALFANGVVAARALADGRLRWSRWLGPMWSDMLGWDGGHAASPLVVGDLVIVPFRLLTALDRGTGEVVWQGDPWPHFAPPVALQVDGVDLLVTPDGQVIRAQDGRVLRRGLAEVWYVNPVVHGRTVFFLEARADATLRAEGGARLLAWRLDGVEGEQVHATHLWTATLPVTRAFYAGPVVDGDHLHAVTHAGELWTVDVATGAVLGETRIRELHPALVFASPTVAGDRLYVTDETGRTAVLTTGPRPRLLEVNALEPTRASPAFVGRRMFLRTERRLVAVEEPAGG